jgi:hypothetical protein
MKKRGSPPKRAARSAKTGFVIGRERFARISAVEGIELSPDMKRRAADLDREGVSGAERRRTIMRAYRKG